MYNLIETSTGVFSITDEKGKNAGSYNLQNLITAIGKMIVDEKLKEFDGNDVKAFLEKLEKDHLKNLTDDLEDEETSTDESSGLDDLLKASIEFNDKKLYSTLDESIKQEGGKNFLQRALDGSVFSSRGAKHLVFELDYTIIGQGDEDDLKEIIDGVNELGGIALLLIENGNAAPHFTLRCSNEKQARKILEFIYGEDDDFEFYLYGE